jgi:flap endonuclease-1
MSTVYRRYHIPEDWPYKEARRLFKEPDVTLDIPELKWTAPDEEVCLLT